MRSLPPGTTHVYERNGEEIYSREVGKTDRKLIGHQYENKVDPRTSDGRPLHEHIEEAQLWGQIRRSALTNPALQKVLDRAIMIYKLSKDQPV